MIVVCSCCIMDLMVDIEEGYFLSVFCYFGNILYFLGEDLNVDEVIIVVEEIKSVDDDVDMLIWIFDYLSENWVDVDFFKICYGWLFDFDLMNEIFCNDGEVDKLLICEYCEGFVVFEKG